MRSTTSFCHGFTIVLLAGAAGRATAQARLAKPVIDTLSHGIVRVRNSGPSQWLGTSGWKLVLEHTITADGGKAVFGTPISIAVDGNGRVIETDWKVDGIQVFEADGRFTRVIGRTGDGPGEFRAPVSVAVSGDTIVAFAGNQRRMTISRSNGALLTQWPANYCCSGTPPVIESRGTILLSGNYSGGRGFIRLRRDGSVVDTVHLPTAADVHAWEVANGGAYTIPFSAYTLGTFDGRGRYVSGNSVYYSLVVALRGVDTARVIALPGKRTPVSAHAADSVFAPFTKRAPLNEIAKRTDIPTEQPYFTGLHADEQDNIWIERPASNGAVAEFDVIDTTGRFLGTVTAPHVSFRLPLFRNGKMYCVAETADGDVVIQVYRIDKGGR